MPLTSRILTATTLALGLAGPGLAQTALIDMAEARAAPLDPLVAGWAAMWNAGDEAALADLYAPGAVYEDLAFQVAFTGHEGIAQWLAITAQAIPDASVTVEDAFRSGDRIAIRWIFAGTPLAIGAMAGSGERFSVPVLTMMEVEGGPHRPGDRRLQPRRPAAPDRPACRGLDPAGPSDRARPVWRTTMTHRPAPVALVLGASGGIGGETAAALARHGWTVRAFARRPPDPGLAGPFKWIAGDAMDADAVRDAAAGAATIVHAVNPPGYRGWGRVVLPMLDNTIAAARETGARIVLPGTIYNYGPDAFPLLWEDSPQTPETVKGGIRVEMEERLKAAARDGVPSLVVRFGDFFGPRPGGNWFSQAMVKPGRPLRTFTQPGAPGAGHAWAYLPDAAETIARLLDRRAELDPFDRFHFAGHLDRDGTALEAAIRRIAGGGLKTKRLPWGLLRLAAPFNESLRELVAMRGFWQRTVALDGGKLAAFLGDVPHTPLEDALRTTFDGLGIEAGSGGSPGPTRAIP